MGLALPPHGHLHFNVSGEIPTHRQVGKALLSAAALQAQCEERGERNDRIRGGHIVLKE